MKYYLSPTGELYAYEPDGSQDHLIPDNFISATSAQVQSIQNPPIDERNLIVSQIVDLETIKLMPRPSRELILLFAEINNLTNTPAYLSLKELDEQIIALRNRL